MLVFGERNEAVLDLDEDEIEPVRRTMDEQRAEDQRERVEPSRSVCGWCSISPDCDIVTIIPPKEAARLV